MTRRKTAQLRAGLVECDKEQQAIGRLMSLLNEQLVATRSSNPDPRMRELAERAGRAGR
jgi:hypothetical protein